MEPRANRLPAIECVEMRFLGTEDERGVKRDDLAEQLVSALEVEIELALADAGTLDYIFEARLGDAALVNQLSRRGNDPFARLATPRGPRSRAHFTEL